MATEFTGRVELDIRDSEADWGPFAAPSAPPNAPNVLYLVWDDVGIATWDCFGGLVEMPAMSRIAERGVRLSQFHTTALCSPTRASLLTGRNATSVGMATIEEFTDGFPNCHGRIPFETALLPEVLAERGWNTYCVGKWHLTPLEESNLASTKRHWPLARGFERFYGFMGGETDQWYPELVYDNHPVAPPATPEEGYHLSKDLADKTIEFIRDAKVIAPDKPWFSYVCPGAGHAPHHVFKEWADKYAGKFDMGYEAYRDLVLENQKRLGIVPPDTELSPMNPYLDVKGPNGEPWPLQDTVRPWDGLSDDEKRLFARMAEVFAGFLSYTDAQIGRILDYLEESGQLDNSLIVVISDNGASGEGGPNGSVNENKFFNGYPDDLAENMAMIDKLGTAATYNHYPTGWATAFSTPLSHVNLRAAAWRIPNAGDKKAREKYGKLDGKIVYYEVTDTQITLREATPAEVAELREQLFHGGGVFRRDLDEVDVRRRRRVGEHRDVGAVRRGIRGDPGDRVLEPPERPARVQRGAAWVGLPERVVEDLERPRAGVPRRHHAGREAGEVEAALAGEEPVVPAPRQHVHGQEGCIRELNEEDAVAGDVGDARGVVAPREHVERVETDADRGVVGEVHRPDQCPPPERSTRRRGSTRAPSGCCRRSPIRRPFSSTS